MAEHSVTVIKVYHLSTSQLTVRIYQLCCRKNRTSTSVGLIVFSDDCLQSSRVCEVVKSMVWYRLHHSHCYHWNNLDCCLTHSLSSRDSLLGRAPDSWSKGCQFQSRQERRENVLLQSQLCVLTLIRCPFHPRVAAVARKRPRSFCQKCRW